MLDNVRQVQRGQVGEPWCGEPVGGQMNERLDSVRQSDQ